MTRLSTIVAAIVACATPALAQSGQTTTAGAASPQPVFVQVGRLLADPQAGTVLRDKTIVIEGSRVVEIRDGFVGEGRIVDLRDGFVLPGLIDSHVHLTSQQNPNGRLEEVTQSNAEQAMVGVGYARKTLMAGFTTVADLGASNEAIIA